MMHNSFFNFKQFNICQDKSAFKVGTDGVLLGASADISNVNSILDIGCGTGLISLMLAQRCNATITAIEPDSESYSQACENINSCNWHDRIKVVHSDLQSFTPDHGRFDLIVTNPPFFSNSLKSPDPGRSAARHNDSLTTRELLEGVLKFLEYNGQFQLIMPYVEGNIFIAEAGNYDLYCNNILKIKPLPTSEIRRMILTFSRIKKNPVERFLTIEYGRRHEFTEEYINLTKDFYLKF
jgi:tRNA1Val (adenine37-N6)-methyltransferase